MVNRKEFLNALTKVKPGIANKEIVESMTYFFFSGTHVVSYNDKISIQYPCVTPFSMFIKADHILNIATKSTAEELEMSDEYEKLNIKSKGMNVNLAAIHDDEVLARLKLIDKSLKKGKWKKVPGNFIECIKLCAFAASKKESDFTLSCVRIDGTNCMATDNNRFALAKLDKKMKPLFLKSSEINNLCSIEPLNYAITGKWAHFKSKDGCIFSIRKVKGKFPDLMELLEFKGTKVKLPDDIMEGTELAKVFIDKLSPVITIALTKNKCILSVSSEAGDIEHKSKIKYKGDSIKFTINPDFLKEMLNHSTDIVISNNRAKLSTGNFTLVTSLDGV